MKTNLFSRFSPSFHDRPIPSAEHPMVIVICTPWNTYLSFDPFTASRPLLLKMSTPLSLSSEPSHELSLFRSASPSAWMPTEDTVESCWCSPSSSRKLGSISITLLRSNAPTPRTRSSATLECDVSMMSANLLILRSLADTADLSSSVTRSTLFRRILSAKATCSTASFSTPSGFTSSRCASTCLASTTVMMASRLACSLISSSTKKVCATGAGSARPVVSIKMASNLSLR
mmetsp:Transcript_6804/g.12724  ORF Transcript_6804/g.12724 Transcript_6804/m.12724 type:complete len:231 (-) Transcript_6804:310-1002(-)